MDMMQQSAAGLLHRRAHKLHRRINCLIKTGDDHNPQKLNFDFTFEGKIIIKFTSQGKALDHDSRELNF